MSLPPEVQERDDQRQLRLLSIFHYIVAAPTLLIALFPLAHLLIGSLLLLKPEEVGSKGSQMPFTPWIGGLFVLFSIVWILGGVTVVVCQVLSARALAQQQHYPLCLVTAGLSSMVFPFGTVLCVFTILVLTRPSVKALFSPSR